MTNNSQTNYGMKLFQNATHYPIQSSKAIADLIDYDLLHSLNPFVDNFTQMYVNFSTGRANLVTQDVYQSHGVYF